MDAIFAGEPIRLYERKTELTWYCVPRTSLRQCGTVTSRYLTIHDRRYDMFPAPWEIDSMTKLYYCYMQGEPYMTFCIYLMQHMALGGEHLFQCIARPINPRLVRNFDVEYFSYDADEYIAAVPDSRLPDEYCPPPAYSGVAPPARRI